MHLTHTVSAEENGLCVREIAAKMQMSAAMLKRFKYHGKITKNGTPVIVTVTVQTGDVLCFSYEEESKPPKDFPMPTVIFEDEYIIALDKPAGLATHPAPRSGASLAEEVIAYWGGGVFRAVNRLDKLTSGIVLAAKDPHTAQLLNRAMQNGGFEKTYCALLSAKPPKVEGEVDAPILSLPHMQKRVIDPKGKPALTKYRMVSETFDGKVWIEANPITGRTHQIRLHMAHIGCPLYADPLYGASIENKTMFLRCISMKFTHPVTGRMELNVE